nr:uncharacterized protein LOC125624040 [Caretta caretta]
MSASRDLQPLLREPGLGSRLALGAGCSEGTKAKSLHTKVTESQDRSTAAPTRQSLPGEWRRAPHTLPSCRLDLSAHGRDCKKEQAQCQRLLGKGDVLCSQLEEAQPFILSMAPGHPSPKPCLAASLHRHTWDLEAVSVPFCSGSHTGSHQRLSPTLTGISGQRGLKSSGSLESGSLTSRSWSNKRYHLTQVSIIMAPTQLQNCNQEYCSPFWALLCQTHFGDLKGVQDKPPNDWGAREHFGRNWRRISCPTLLFTSESMAQPRLLGMLGSLSRVQSRPVRGCTTTCPIGCLTELYCSSAKPGPLTNSHQRAGHTLSVCLATAWPSSPDLSSLPATHQSRTGIHQPQLLLAG